MSRLNVAPVLFSLLLLPVSCGGDEGEDAGSGNGNSDGVDRLDPQPVPVDPDALIGTWVVDSEKSDDCNWDTAEEVTKESTHLIFQLSEGQDRLEALRRYGATTNCMDISASERRFPLDDNGQAGEGQVIYSSDAETEADCLVNRSRHFLLAKNDGNYVYVRIFEEGPGDWSNDRCSYDREAEFTCTGRTWLELSPYEE